MLGEKEEASMGKEDVYFCETSSFTKPGGQQAQPPPVSAHYSAEVTGTHSTRGCVGQCKCSSPQSNLPRLTRDLSRLFLMFLAIALTESPRLQLFEIPLLNLA